MLYYDRSLNKNEEDKYNSLNNILPYLTTKLPLTLTLDNNNLENNSINNSELDSKEFISFLYEKDSNNINYLPSYEFPPQHHINLKEEEKIKEKSNEIENIPEKDMKFIEIKQNNNIKFIISKNSNKIFNIEKIIKLGRIKKSSNKIGKHDKFKKDNIIRKFKVLLTKNIYNYLNSSFIVNKNKQSKKIVKVIKKISYKFTKSIVKKDNINWLNSTIKDYFSNIISTRFFTYDNKYNQRIINKIYKKGKEKDAIEILDKTIKEFWQVYINDDIENKYIGFATIKDDINKFVEKGESEKYIKMYIEVANQFETIFTTMKTREKKK